MHTRRTLGLATGLATVLACACLPAATTHAGPTPVRSDTIIVTFDHSQADPAAAARAAVTDAAQDIADADVTSVTPISAGLVAVTFDTPLTSSEHAELGDAVEDEAGVHAAEPSTTFHVTSAGDPTGEQYWSYLWNLGSAWGVKAPQAWSRSTGAGAVVGVVDTGITAHPDLTGSATAIVGGNVIAGYDFISTPAVARDGDGRDADPTDRAPSSSFHGTHVSGIVGALVNGRGVAGTAPGVRIEPLRAMGEGGGTDGDIMAAMRWGAGLTVPGLPVNPTPVDVLNLSLGGTGSCTVAMKSTIDAVTARGVAVVVSAGNAAGSLANVSPANCRGVIRVTATGATGRLASYSNVGTAAVPATIAAPGGSSVPNPANGRTGAIVSTGNDGVTGVGKPAYVAMTGTSMAAPHVSGVVAMLKSARRSLTPAAITAILQKTASPLGTACGVSVCGAGLVDAAAAVANQVPAPALPTLTVTKRPAITGTRAVGRKLTGHTGKWTPAPSLARRWLRDGRPIAGATGSTYRLTRTDRGHRLQLRVTATRKGYTTKVVLTSAVKVR